MNEQDERVVDCGTSGRLTYNIMMEAYYMGWVGKEEPTELRMERFCAAVLIERLKQIDPRVREMAINDIRFQGARLIEDPTMLRGEILFHNPHRPDLDVKLINVTC